MSSCPGLDPGIHRNKAAGESPPFLLLTSVAIRATQFQFHSNLQTDEFREWPYPVLRSWDGAFYFRGQNSCTGFHLWEQVF
jgi:hypothetical protein